MKFTDEQSAMIQSKGNVVVGNAFAGTGKTSMLIGHALARPKEKILCCVLNKSVAMEARERFPSNVKSITSHAIAFGQIGKHYQHKLGQPRPFQIAKAFNLPFANEQHKIMISFLALETLRQYMTMPDMIITDQHVPKHEAKRSGFSVGEVMKLANDIWNRMIDPQDPLPCPHDCYLKLYQLSKPDLSYYDQIYLDESQDLNPVTLAIMSQQTQSRQVLVGDTHQGIYGFRNSIDALSSVNADEYYYLTQSWRFGPQLAEVANRILRTFKGETRLLKGYGPEGSTRAVDMVKPYTILCRTNAGIFDAAVQAMEEHDNAKFNFAGGIQGYAFDQLEDTWRLMKGKKGDIRDAYIKSFSSYQQMQEYAEGIDDKELKARIRVCEKYKDAVPVKLSQVRAKSSETDGFITLSTAHKSKGLEWDQVKLWSDFPDMVNDKGIPLTDKNVLRMNDPDVEPLDTEEANLLYVAVTRAQKVLDYSHCSLNDFLNSKLTLLEKSENTIVDQLEGEKDKKKLDDFLSF